MCMSEEELLRIVSHGWAYVGFGLIVIAVIIMLFKVRARSPEQN